MTGEFRNWTCNYLKMEIDPWVLFSTRLDKVGLGGPTSHKYQNTHTFSFVQGSRIILFVQSWLLPTKRR